MAAGVYYPGYYLSKLHLTNVLHDLEDCLYPEPLSKCPPRAAKASAAEESSGASNNETKDSADDLDDLKYSPEYLRRLLNLYRPIHRPLPLSLRMFQDRLRENTEKHLDDDQYTRGESPHRYHGKYAAPACGMPQSMADYGLNERLKTLIHGELCQSPHMHRSKSPVRASAAAPSSPQKKVSFDDSDYVPRYNPYLDEYMFPVLLQGYRYPYTRWLMLKRELERIQRRNASQKEVLQSLEVDHVPGPSHACKSRGGHNHVTHNHHHHHHESSPAPVSTGAGVVPHGAGCLSFVRDAPAYNYRHRPWEYMQLLRHQAYQRQMSAL